MTDPTPSRIEFDPQLHNLQLEVDLPLSLRQALAWQIAAELVRRNPDLLHLREGASHHNAPILEVLHRRPNADGGIRPVAGLYWPSLSIMTPDTYTSGGASFTWLEALLSDRREYIVKQLERTSGLPSPTGTPPTSRASIGPRLIAAFLQRTSLDSLRWVATCGWAVDEYGDEPNEELFSALPQLNAERSTSPITEAEQRDSRYWFICPLDEGNLQPPVAGIDVNEGIAWTPSQRTDLVLRYRQLDSHIDALVSDVIPPAR